LLLNYIKALAVAAVLAATASSACAEADGPDYFMVVNVSSDDVLNIWIDPTANSDKAGEIPAYATGIQNLGCYGQLTYAQYESFGFRAGCQHAPWLV